MKLKIFKGGVSLLPYLELNEEPPKSIRFDTEVNIIGDCEPLSPEKQKKVVSMFRKAIKKALKEIEGKNF